MKNGCMSNGERSIRMKDTIYREDAIKALRCEYPTMPMFKNLREEWTIKTEGFRKAEEVIMSIPSAENTGALDDAICGYVQSGLMPSPYDRPQLDKDIVEPIGNGNVIMSEDTYEELLADRPQGDVDAVAIFMREMHSLEQGYITIGEFDERIEPLRHLCYGRPQGEWIRTGRTNIYGGIEVQCSNCGDRVMVKHLEDEWYCRHCGADMGMKGADDEV